MVDLKNFNSWMK